MSSDKIALYIVHNPSTHVQLMAIPEVYYNPKDFKIASLRKFYKMEDLVNYAKELITEINSNKDRVEPYTLKDQSDDYLLKRILDL